MTISLGTISFDEAILLRQLRQDMRDDWFPDALGYEDLMRSGDPRSRIEQNFTANHGRYVPTSRDVFNIPKPNFTVRYGLETSICDRVVYHALASSISVHIDPLIPPVIYSHRRDPHRRDERYFFRRSIAAWQDFVGSVRADLQPGEQLLSTDLTNYFDNIDLVKLRDLLSDLITQANCSPAEKAQLRSEVTLLFQLLQDWTFEIGRGLPQNRDASSFLANVYMLPIDLAMRGKGYRYFRYMDDIKIICPDVYAARRALKDLIVELRDRGLAVNSKRQRSAL
ncbi:RNA-directed DNA polymerase [Caulobacter segnis]|uniref:RNA-directed DNA polymerase n=1 Tax=Caulobacter segnis TaxID=88688 RepID=UPI001CBD8D77|nr:RNA-directed DNA polymerase [Caulobacter segnis]UAL12549.1 RNA-directed DNA polymerase [Caulobacter segnis]